MRSANASKYADVILHRMATEHSPDSDPSMDDSPLYGAGEIRRALVEAYQAGAAEAQHIFRGEGGFSLQDLGAMLKKRRELIVGVALKMFEDVRRKEPRGGNFDEAVDLALERTFQFLHKVTTHE